jgi:hydroxypyruvate isomerase
MIRYAANLTMLFNEVPFLERFEKAAAAGFRAVEFLFIHNVDASAVQRELGRHGLELVLFDPEGGDFAAGDRGYLCDPGRRDHLHTTIQDAIAVARTVGCRRLNVLAGNRPPGVPERILRRTAVENLKRAAPLAREAGITLLVEMLNVWESPRYFLDRLELGLDIVREVAEPNVRFQFDCYHVQRMEGQLIDGLVKNLAWIGHVQVADVPGRHEPGTGEIHHDNVLAALEAAGYDGYVGLEYRPSGKTEDSLAWLSREARARQ